MERLSKIKTQKDNIKKCLEHEKKYKNHQLESIIFLLEKIAGCKAPEFCCIVEEPKKIEPIKINEKILIIEPTPIDNVVDVIDVEENKPEPSEYDEQDVEEVVVKKVRVKKVNQKYINN